ncbi:MAG: o-succinylbenzoate synthase [Bacteroidota bacterium]|nr:o-succinylbenzoate synthase [Bacteroidota bacterium]
MKAHFYQYNLSFKKPSGTSRGILHQKESWILVIQENEKIGVGEASIIRGLSIDDSADYESKLKWLCENINLDREFLFTQLKAFPSIQFALETAFLSLDSMYSPFVLFPSDFVFNQKPIPINGLVWMGDKDVMKTQIENLIERNFRCIKLKIGAINFEEELALLGYIRSKFSENELEIRVDANGAFSEREVLDNLHQLSKFRLHSIEQPIKQGNTQLMKELCRITPIPIALDEELIGVFDLESKKELLSEILPQYIILKPSLIGGFTAARQWIDLANQFGIGWWMTSALESNIGLNAIAQFTATLNNTMPQGLGTGSLYTNNFESPLEVINDSLVYKKDKDWNLIQILKSR